MVVEFDMLVHGGSLLCWFIVVVEKERTNQTIYFKRAFLHLFVLHSLSRSPSPPHLSKQLDYTHSCTSPPPPPPPLDEVATDDNVSCSTDLLTKRTRCERQAWSGGPDSGEVSSVVIPLLWSTGWPCSHRPFSCLNSLLLI